MKKILVTSPVGSGLTVSYVRAVIALLNSPLCRGVDAPYLINFAWTSGTSAAMARDENANLFMSSDYDEMVQWDIDMGVSDPGLMVAMFKRLLEHDVDVVGAAYVTHKFSSVFHGSSLGEQTARPDGLMRMAQVPLGFSKTKRSAFERIRAANPQLQYIMKETGMEKAKSGMIEYFPTGIMGPNTAHGKVERIKALTTGAVSAADIAAIKAIINDSNYSESVLVGEDYYFCKLALDAGVEMYVDTNMIVPHQTKIDLPVTNSMLLNSLNEPWRWASGSTPDEVQKAVHAIQKLVAPDHI